MSQMPQFGGPSSGVKPHRGTMIMVLGILSIFVCQIILGPIAWIMGNNDLKEMAAGRMDRSGEQQTKTGKICGMVGTFLAIGIICLYVIIFLVVGLGAAANQG